MMHNNKAIQINNTEKLQILTTKWLDFSNFLDLLVILLSVHFDLEVNTCFLYQVSQFLQEKGRFCQRIQITCGCSERNGRS